MVSAKFLKVLYITIDNIYSIEMLQITDKSTHWTIEDVLALVQMIINNW